jgi:enoyl-CoA hydratase/carnithine racemase
MSGDVDVRYEVAGPVARLTIDREERRNALRAQTVSQLLEGLGRANTDPDVRVICLTGAGERAFCAGADLAGGSGPGGFRVYAELLEAMADSRRPLVARVAGACVGGGMGLMLACDLAYAADDVKVGTPEVNVGLFPMMVTALLPRHTSRKRVLEMALTGELVGAAEAERMGLITRACPRAELDAAVDRVLAAVASKAPLAVERGRRAFNAVESMGGPAALDHLCEQLEELARTADAVEGVRAFAEKRPPRWTGR